MAAISCDPGIESLLRERLEAIPGVERVLIEGDAEAVWLVCDMESACPDALQQARAVLERQGLDPDRTHWHAAVPVERIQRRRVRFVDVRVSEEPDRQIRVSVELEWSGNTAVGDAIGEKGAAIELRTAALAALVALERITGEPLDVRLAGVKQVRAFDEELMVVALYGPGKPGQRLIGTVLGGTEPRRAAALAVLSALNRMLGNYLVTR